MGLLESSEKKFGKYAIRGLTNKLATIQVVFFLLILFKSWQKFTFGDVLETLLKLNIPHTTFITDTILTLATPAILPGNTFSFLWMFFGTQLFLIYGRALEELWGDWRFNLYILTNVVIAVGLSAIFSKGLPLTAITGISILQFSLMFAFATHYPKFELLLFFVIPTPIWILALVAAGFLIFNALDMPTLFKLFIWCSAFGAYILFHIKHFIKSQSQKKRSLQFEKKVKIEKSKGFHKCKVCGKTELDQDDIDFRIGNDGEEYCMEHLTK